MINTVAEIPRAELEALCRRWKIKELSLFGSFARGEARPDSDVDVLVTFDPEAPWNSWDLIDLQDELATMFQRKVDLVEERVLDNPFRRRSILRDKTVLHAA